MSYKDSNKNREYQREWSRKRTEENSRKAVEMLGGKCETCGIDDYRVLQIDHKEPILRNTPGVKSGIRNRQRLARGLMSQEEIENLQLLCANCHQIKSYEERVKHKKYINEQSIA